MTDITIERAHAADAGSVVALLDAAAEWQRDHGIDLWTPGQFNEDVRQTTAKGDLYVCRRQGVIVGCFMLDEGSARMSRWLTDHGRRPERGVVGRLTVTRESAGQGLGMELLRAADQLASSRGIAFLRLECPADDQGLRRYYVGAGFTHIGDNDLPGPKGEPWVSSVYERPTHAHAFVVSEPVGPWQRLSRRVAYENEWIAVYDDEVVQPDGAAGVYGVVHPKFLAAGIVALDHDDRVLLVGQHRYTLDLLTWGIPGGGVPFDEDPLEGAKRELAEETGYTAVTWHELARFTLSNSITDGRGVVFLATDLSEGMPHRDGTEVGMTARRVPFSEALDLVDSGEIHDVFTQVGLLAADRYLRGRS